MNLNPSTDPTQSAPSAEPAGISESAKICPSCNYAGDTEFTTCPSCGLIIRKYFTSRLQEATVPTSSNNVGRRAVGKGLLTGCCLLMVAVGLVVYLLNRPAPKKISSSPSPIETASNASSENPSTGEAPPTSSIDTLPNNLGITIQRVIFASEVDASNMPVDNLTRVPFKGKKVVVQVKMVIPPEKSYKFTGKFYDGEGKLVMNVSSPSTPTLSAWYAWYYHNLDRADDKPGTWKFVFLVNDEPVLEKAIEVVDL